MPSTFIAFSTNPIKRGFIWVVPFVVLSFLGGTASAQSSPALAFDLGSTSLSGFGPATIGWEFSPNSDIIVTDLGYIDTGSPGLGITHRVGIWDSSGTLVVSTTVQAGVSGSLVGNFRYESIPPSMLVAGAVYIVGAEVGSADTTGVGGLNPLPPGFALAPEISLVGGRVGPQPFNFPNSPSGPGRIYLGPNFQYQSDEPALEALIDISPGTLNMKSQGRWLTAYITLPEGFDVADIDVTAVAINSLAGATCDPDYEQPADLSYSPQIGDRDEDGITDLTVKFDRQELLANLCLDDVAITIAGTLSTGEKFVGSDSIQVISRGK